ncbi:MAG: hypothetical protein A3C93_06360 [Candidatus Lloydbacteria bacterium RIFCSPHIGHO2_02_FULL_54_17]|uniref:Transglycosylase SLT domain-containing protein n=1 Tax=Candidatus Lloydbacteria bacterium RIFCSPHIGHO2_02_FULL_54_17 TaxID=1798664 RepID=A0A1G2DIK0_9BACT|nr:MAG: hypothetical protein A2762_01315 [Candidatus Lloydbacteria bacterium RIFCSPHIGHO2_01_FULL_54_11]OGZ12700.1 MAG: hypothetical protein A3C93_06360 [Candidatus Lloydbacteria bacterium RIFCSPHIGHO2_02_FULL_54_17]OGZ13552.1 MAG: hypothetical protein A2948_05025 [Candidatus Lloydbacteria bacterium RIFCSPLOWO2_01_FULL_54_18]OGZ16221.1 MAG: hypothetical protein A3H76_03855 [Candidatus Lloydbacteria bacterium RIFCSPLOWO2_02_FULL_54_12]
MERIAYYALFWALFALGLFWWPKQSEKTDVAESKKAVTVLVEAKTVHVTRKLSKGEFELLLEKSPWPKHLHAAVKRVAFCESSWIPTAKGPTDDHGLLQIRLKDHAEKVGRAADLYDPLTNLSIAHQIYSDAERGKFKHSFAPWYMSNKCHGLVPAKVAAHIKKWRTKKVMLAKAQ